MRKQGAARVPQRPPEGGGRTGVGERSREGSRDHTMLRQVHSELAQELETGRRGRPGGEEPEAERHPLSGTGEGRSDTGHSEKTGLRVLEDLVRRTVLIEHRASVPEGSPVEPTAFRKAALPHFRAEAC